MIDEISVLCAVAHLRSFPNFICNINYHQFKVAFMMEFFGDHETETAATLLDVANHASNASKVNKCQAILLVRDIVQALVDQQAEANIHGDIELSNVVVIRKGSKVDSMLTLSTVKNWLTWASQKEK